MNTIKIVKERIVSIWNLGGFHVVIGNFLNKFVVFFGSILVVRLLTKFEYGGLSYIENLYSFLYLMAGFGISNAVLRFVIIEKEIEGKKAAFDYMFKVAIIINIFLVIFGCIINYFYPHAEKFNNISNLLYIMILMLPAQYSVDVSLTLERAFLDNKCFAYFNFAYSAVVIIGKCLGAYGDGVEGVVIVGVIIQYIFISILFYVNKKKFFNNINGKMNLEKRKKREIIIYSIQYMFTNGMWTMFMLIDIFLLGVFIKAPSIIADYKIAYAWPANISIVCSAIGMFIIPYFIEHEANSNWIRTNYRKVFTVNFLLVLIISIIMCFLAKPLIFIYGGEKYYNVIPLLRVILISSFVNNGLRYLTANCLAAMGQIKENMIVSLFGLIAQIVLNLCLIPRFGIYGPAYTGIIVYTCMAVVLFIVFNKKYKIISSKI